MKTTYAFEIQPTGGTGLRMVEFIMVGNFAVQSPPAFYVPLGSMLSRIGAVGSGTETVRLLDARGIQTNSLVHRKVALRDGQFLPATVYCRNMTKMISSREISATARFRPLCRGIRTKCFLVSFQLDRAYVVASNSSLGNRRRRLVVARNVIEA